MKINGPIPSVTPNEAAGLGKPATHANRNASAAATDQVELSPLSAQIQDAGASAANTPTIDAARIAEIKQAISDGRFQINPDRIADGLLDSVRQMLSRQLG